MKSKESTLFYHEWIYLLEDFTEAEVGALTIAILTYDRTGVATAFTDRAMNQAFRAMRLQVDRDRKKYEERCEQNRENGKKGGRPSENQTKPNGSEQNRTKPKKPDNDYDNDNDNDIYMTNYHSDTKVYTGAPEESQVKTYFESRGKSAREADAFYRYYQKQQWTIAGTPIRYWRKVADKWIANATRKSVFEQRSDALPMQAIVDHDMGTGPPGDVEQMLKNFIEEDVT